MPKKLKIKDVEGVKKGVREYFSSNIDARFAHRLDLILLLCNGHSAKEVSELYGLNKATIHRWVHKLNDKGIEGLLERSKAGRPRDLPKEKFVELRGDLTKSPIDFGYKQGRWDGKLLSYHLKEKYGVLLKVRRCQMLFHELGFSLQRPRKMPKGGDPEKREAFKKNSGKRY
jgi:transposase